MRDTIDMARESWIDVYGLGHDRSNFIEALKDFEALVRADEREACAKLCDDLPAPERMSLDNESLWEAATLDCADAIRNRGNT
jgi:hypothetical protein